MNNAKIAGIAGGVVVVVGLLIWLVMMGPDDAADNAETANNAAQNNAVRNEQQEQGDAAMQERQVSGTLDDLLALDSDESLRCTYAYQAEDGSRFDGTTYVDPEGSRLRSDFESTVEGTGVIAHLLVVDDTFYVWSDNEPQGIAFPVTEGLTSAQAVHEQGGYASEVTQREVDYECEDYSAANVSWEPPQNVAFIDFSIFSTSTIPTAEQLESINVQMEAQSR